MEHLALLDRSSGLTKFTYMGLISPKEPEEIVFLTLLAEYVQNLS